MKTILLDIDSDKLRSLINDHGGIYEVAYYTGFTTACIYNTLRRGTISKKFAEALEKIEIPFKDYGVFPEPPEEPTNEAVLNTADDTDKRIEMAIGLLIEINANLRSLVNALGV